MSDPYQPSGGPDDHAQNIAAAIADVSEKASQLVREEIELAKAEVTEKAGRLLRGGVVLGVAGVFFLTALLFVLIGGAWLAYYLIPGNDWAFFWGFFAMAGILVVLGLFGAFIAWRLVRRSAPPTPDMAIDEARKIREAVSAPPPPPVPGPPVPPGPVGDAAGTPPGSA